MAIQISKIEKSASYQDIKSKYAAVAAKLRTGKISYKEFFTKEIVPMVDPAENLNYYNFWNWVKVMESASMEIDEAHGLIDKEKKRTRNQIIIRQEATTLMKDFLGAVKVLADDPMALHKSGIKVLDIYKIIREEEDRQKAVNLKERSENRADAAFSMLVAATRAGQLNDDDIQYLSDDIKKELISLKQSNGVYQLPGTHADSLDDEANPDG